MVDVTLCSDSKSEAAEMVLSCPGILVGECPLTRIDRRWFYDRIQASASYARMGLDTQGLGSDMRCGASEAGTGEAGYSRVHRGNEPRGIVRGCEDLPVPDWCGLNPEIAG